MSAEAQKPTYPRLVERLPARGCQALLMCRPEDVERLAASAITRLGGQVRITDGLDEACVEAFRRGFDLAVIGPRCVDPSGAGAGLFAAATRLRAAGRGRAGAIIVVLPSIGIRERRLAEAFDIDGYVTVAHATTKLDPLLQLLWPKLASGSCPNSIGAAELDHVKQHDDGDEAQDQTKRDQFHPPAGKVQQRP